MRFMIKILSDTVCIRVQSKLDHPWFIVQLWCVSPSHQNFVISGNSKKSVVLPTIQPMWDEGRTVRAEGVG